MFSEEYAKRLETLFPRQRAVVDLIAQGYEDTEIAEALNISVMTVKTHVWNSLKFLNLPSRVALVVWAHTGLRRDRTFVHKSRA